ncbi:hypothetical protein BC830DRAFT_1144194 [Chytriomyces sp. MP71]|nr:hypothetical protein BC830DRAFT_1144194 [Chytriomyces sp. MP71]
MTTMNEGMLSRGAVQRLNTSGTGAENGPSTLQVLNVKKMTSTGESSVATDRYRVILSDGVYAMQGMLATQLNPLIADNVVIKHSVVRIDKLLCNEVGGKRILIILDMTCLNPGDDQCPRLGNPSMDLTSSLQQPQPQHQPPQAQHPHHQQYNQNQTTNLSHKQPMYNQQQNNYNQQEQQHPQNFYNQNQHHQQPPQQRQQMHQQQSNPSDVAIFPIKSLSPYQNKWTIRVRLISKGDMREYNNAKGPGKLFSMTFGDDSGEIRATAFNDTADHFYGILVVNRVYYLSKAQIKIANRNYSGGVNNDYEMTLDLGTMLTECTDSSAMPQILFKRVLLDGLMEYEKDHTIDIVCIVTEVNPVSEITTKAGKQLKKREITVADESNHTCRLTLWGNQAESFPELDSNAAANPIYIFKGVRVNDFGGRSLSMPSGGSILPDPDVREAHEVRGWWMRQGVNGGMVGYSGASGAGGGGGGQVTGVRGFKSLSRIAEENMGHQEKPDWLSFRATIAYIKEDRDMWYPACRSEGCSKKVTDTGNGWRCEKCDKSHPSPSYRYIFNCKIADHSGESWVSFFNEQGETLFGMSANDMAMIKDTDAERFKGVLNSLLWKQFDFRARVKADNYGDEQRVRTNVHSVDVINYGTAAIDLADAIAAYN